MYTGTVMRIAAAEAARAAATDYDGDLADVREFAARRLKAVPEVSIFHVGGADDWQIDLAGSGGSVSVTIVGHARPLPLLGVLATAFAESDGTGVVLRASVDEKFLPDWVEGDYGTWQTIWG